MTAVRKQHVTVPQSEYLRVMQDVGLGSVVLEDIAEHLGVSPTTARRKLDGLVAQGKVAVEPGHNRAYRLVER